ncbi:hypothetical protein Bca101_066809 [Brassica carinata]
MFFFYSAHCRQMELELCDTSTCSASPTTAAQSLVSNTLILVRVSTHLEASSMAVSPAPSSITRCHDRLIYSQLSLVKRHTYRQLEIKKDIDKLHQRFMSSLCDLVSSCRCRVKWRPATHLVNVKSNRSFLFIMPE